MHQWSVDSIKHHYLKRVIRHGIDVVAAYVNTAVDHFETGLRSEKDFFRPDHHVVSGVFIREEAWTDMWCHILALRYTSDQQPFNRRWELVIEASDVDVSEIPTNLPGVDSVLKQTASAREGMGRKPLY